MKTPMESDPMLHVIDHATARCALTVLRASATPPILFRDSMRQLGIALAIAALGDRETRPVEVRTPVGSAPGHEPARPVVIVPILRAGLGLMEGMLAVFPNALVGHIGTFRDEKSLQPVQYYYRVPPQMPGAEVLLVDPMLATGNSAAAALSLLKKSGARRLRFAGVVGCPEGVERLRSTHPDVPVFLVAVDPGLNANGYIVPGLGDAGDRFFGTTGADEASPENQPEST